MEARISIKIALFCALSALVCTIANCFIGLIEIAYVAEALWFVAYVSAVVWLCKYVNNLKKNGKHLTVTFFTFALALYLGLYSGFVADEIIATYTYLMFYIAAIVCLGSVLVLIAKWVFGSSPKEKTDSPTKVVIEKTNWICACGTENTGRFCSECGNSKPEEPAQNVEEA